MTIITQLKALYEQEQFYQALEVLNGEISRLKSLRYTDLKKEFEKIESAEDFKIILKCTDHFLMYNYSAFIVRFAYRRFQNLLTASWYCEELLDGGRPLEAEEIITHVITESKEDISKSESLESAYFSKIRCLLEMKRFMEIDPLLEKLQESSRPIEDKLGYIHLQMGNREKAEEFLKMGLKDPERGRYCYLLLSDLYAANGRPMEALKLIEEGEALYPETLTFLVEKVKRYRDLGKPCEMLEVIKQLNERIPLHVYQKYFRHLTGNAFYQLEDFTRLEDFIKEESLTSSLFIRKKEAGELIKLKIRPIVQKSNYCVPASLEMILNYYGMNKTQDEIASHIFDFTGSRLSTTVAYLEELGFSCRYFIGNKERYEQLLKQGIPILLSVDFEHSSHVQVMTGYDSRFDFYHIQDPNMLEGMYVSSEELQKANRATNYMSIVAVPNERAEEIVFLSHEEDTYFRTLHDFGEKMEEDESRYKESFFQFLQENIEIPYTPIYVVKHFSFDEYGDFIIACAEKLLLEYPNSDFFNLHVAQAYLRLSKMELSEDQLAKTTRKTFSTLYHFLKGRISLYFDKPEEAAHFFRSSLQLDPDQYYIWSYLALSYLYQKDIVQAEFFSKISMMLAPDDRFIRMNHAAVLREKNEYENARKLYNALIKEEPKDAHAWYERAHLDQKLGKLRKALRGYLVSMKLDNETPFAYLAAADLLELEFDQWEKAEEILLSGIHLAKSSQIYVRLGDLYKDQEEWSKAINIYQTCISLFPDERFAYFGMAESMANDDQKEEAVQYLKKNAGRFENDSEFLINCGRIFADWAKEEEILPLLEDGLSLFEKGMEFIHSNLYDALEIYVGLVEETTLVDRAIEFLGEKSAQHPNIIEYKCFQGTLYEEKQQYAQAIATYKSALKVRVDSFPYYRLGAVYFNLNQLDLAEDAYKKCLELDAKVVHAYLKLAEIALYQEKPEEEVDYLLRLLEIAPINVNVEYLTSILDEKGLHNLLNKLENLQGSSPEAWRLDMLAYTHGALGNIEAEVSTLMAALDIEPEQPELLHHQAKLFIKLKKWEKVSLRLKQLLNKYYEDEDLFKTLIQFTAASNRWTALEEFLHHFNGTSEEKGSMFQLAAEAVEEHFRGIDWLEEDEGNVFTRFVRKLKNRFKQMKIFGTAIGLYETAIKLNPDNLNLVSRFAKFYEDFDLMDDAIKVLLKAISAAWDDRIAYQLGMIYLDSKDYQAAWPLFEKCLQEDSENSHLQSVAAYIIGEQGDLAEAEKRMKQVIAENPFENHAHSHLGRWLNKQGKYAEAKDLLEKGMEIHPFDPSIKLQLSVTLSYLNENEKALEMINRVLEMEDENLLAHYNKACYLALLNRTSEAQQVLDFVIENEETDYFRQLAEQDEDLVNLKIG
ncbi:tetratricopeptide repeat protein [Neobacillus sp. NRS-1170]|uniref:tetratricopeptide repeat protein n=1 Tax=Neobacillus sp. NRS-1170 TaxID=3233898 RepID=UPI003D2B585C